jgi:hypothetical protein
MSNFSDAPIFLPGLGHMNRSMRTLPSAQTPRPPAVRLLRGSIWLGRPLYHVRIRTNPLYARSGTHYLELAVSQSSMCHLGAGPHFQLHHVICTSQRDGRDLSLSKQTIRRVDSSRQHVIYHELPPEHGMTAETARAQRRMATITHRTLNAKMRRLT